MNDKVSAAAHIRSEDRLPGCKSFQQHFGKTLPPRHQSKHISRLHQLLNILTISEELHLIL
ncbi:hypothetical protein D3C81_1975510 [compost metagenome]